MDLVVAWLVFPVVLLSLATGWGCAVTRLCRVRLPGELVPPLGFAAIVVVSGLITLVPRAAEFATPVVVGGAVAGLAANKPKAAETAATTPCATPTAVRHPLPHAQPSAVVETVKVGRARRGIVDVSRFEAVPLEA